MSFTLMHVNLAKGFRGGERQTALLIEQLSTRPQIRQYLVCRRNSPLRQELANVPNLAFVTANHQLDGHLRLPHADLLHAHEAKAVHWCLIEERLRHTPYLLTRRVPQAVKDNPFNRLCYRHAQRAVAISSVIARHLTERGWCPVDTIPSALAHLPHQEEQTKWIRAQWPESFLIGHIGALVDKHKGQRVLIEAAALLEKTLPQARFVLLGDGVDGEALRAESRHLSNIEWLGFKQNVGDYLAAFDLFAFPSRNEGLGSTLLDVMDYGVPVVASNVDGIPDLVHHGETGLLVESGRADQLAAAITELYQSPDVRQQLTANARRFIENFTPEAMANRYLALYRQLVPTADQERD